MGVHPSHILPGTDKSFRYALPRLKAVVKCSVQLTGEIETKTSCMSRPGRAGMMPYLLHSIMFPTLHGGAPCQTVVPSFGEVKNKSDLTGLPPRHTMCGVKVQMVRDVSRSEACSFGFREAGASKQTTNVLGTGHGSMG